MGDSVSVNSVQPSEISSEMVAYYLTASILGGSGYGSASWASSSGIPIIHGRSKEEILTTYTECLRAVHRRQTDTEVQNRRS
jgi:hypothetical protein